MSVKLRFPLFEKSVPERDFRERKVEPLTSSTNVLFEYLEELAPSCVSPGSFPSLFHSRTGGSNTTLLIPKRCVTSIRTWLSFIDHLRSFEGVPLIVVAQRFSFYLSSPIVQRTQFLNLKKVKKCVLFKSCTIFWSCSS